MSATTLLGAVVALFDADQTLAADVAGTGGLWVGGVPEEKNSLPLVGLLHHDEVPDWNFEGQVMEESGRFDFVVYAKGLAAADLVATHLKAVFDPSSQARAQATPGDWVNLDLANTTRAQVMRAGYRVRLVSDRAADSGWVYEVTLPYESEVAKRI